MKIDVVKNILGNDVDEEVRMLKEDIHHAYRKGDKARVMHLQERMEGMM